MIKLDPRVHEAIAQSRSSSHGPPPGHEEQMLAQFHARLGGPPTDGGIDPSAGASVSAAGSVVHALKICAAVVGLTAAGLGGLWAVGAATRALGENQADVDRAPSIASAPVDRQPSKAEAEPRPLAPVPEQPDAAAAPAITPATAPASKTEQPLPTSSQATEAGASSASTLAAELALLDEAQRASPADALVLLERHAKEFPTGELRHERDSLRIIALCDLDRSSDAQEAVDRFVAAKPGPLLIRRALDRCGKKVSVPPTDLE